MRLAFDHQFNSTDVSVMQSILTKLLEFPSNCVNLWPAAFQNDLFLIWYLVTLICFLAF